MIHFEIARVCYGAKWRLPGGRVDLHETIAEAAERELFEECGIDARFESILGFRETLQDFILFLVIFKKTFHCFLKFGGVKIGLIV